MKEAFPTIQVEDKSNFNGGGIDPCAIDQDQLIVDVEAMAVTADDRSATDKSVNPSTKEKDVDPVQLEDLNRPIHPTT